MGHSIIRGLQSIKASIYVILILLGCSIGVGEQSPLNDADIAEILEVCQKVRFDFASMALQKAETNEVKEFASHILTDYKEETLPIPIFAKNSNQNALNIRSEIKALSRSLKMNKGKDFDEAYLKTQMDWHKQTMKNFKENLIPAAKDPELKNTLVKVYDDMDDYVDDTLDTYISIKK